MGLVTEQAFRSFKRGESWGFGEIFKSCNDPIMAYSFKLTQNVQNAEDLTMEAFVLLWNHRDSLKNADGCYWYLRTIITNKHYDSIKRAKTVRRYHILKPPEEKVTEKTCDRIENKERNLAIQFALQELPGKTRLYTHMYLDGMKQRDIRKLTGKSKSCITSSLTRGVRKMVRNEKLLECIN